MIDTNASFFVYAHALRGENNKKLCGIFIHTIFICHRTSKSPVAIERNWRNNINKLTRANMYLATAMAPAAWRQICHNVNSNFGLSFNKQATTQLAESSREFAVRLVPLSVKSIWADSKSFIRLCCCFIIYAHPAYFVFIVSFTIFICAVYTIHLVRFTRQTFQFSHIFALSVSVDNREKTFCFSLTVSRMLSAFAGSARPNITAPSVVQFKFRCKCAVNKHQQNYIHSAAHEAKVIIKIYIGIRTRSVSSHISL